MAARVQVSPDAELAIDAGSDERTATLAPRDGLEPGTQYRFTLQAPDGSLAASWAFRVRSPVHVLSTIPGDRTTAVPVRTGIEVTFDQDGVADMRDHFTIEPAVPGRFERHGRTQVFVPDTLADGTLYTVTIAAGLPRDRHRPGARVRRRVPLRDRGRGRSHAVAAVRPRHRRDQPHRGRPSSASTGSTPSRPTPSRRRPPPRRRRSASTASRRSTRPPRCSRTSWSRRAGRALDPADADRGAAGRGHVLGDHRAALPRRGRRHDPLPGAAAEGLVHRRDPGRPAQPGLPPGHAGVGVGLRADRPDRGLGQRHLDRQADRRGDRRGARRGVDRALRRGRPRDRADARRPGAAGRGRRPRGPRQHLPCWRSDPPPATSSSSPSRSAGTAASTAASGGRGPRPRTRPTGRCCSRSASSTGRPT